MIGVTYPDKHLLETIVKEIEFTGDIRKTINGGGFCNGAPTAVLNFSSEVMATDLRRIGLYPNKSLTLPSIVNEEYIPDNLVRHLIRGYFDGDGSIHSSNSTTYHKLKNGETKKYTYLSHTFSVSGTIGVLNDISLHMGLGCKLKDSVTDEIKYLCAYSIDDLNHIYTYMYEDANIYLEKKHRKWKKVISDINK